MKVVVLDDADAVAREGAARVRHAAATALDAHGAHGSFKLALAGGTTPRRLYEQLAARSTPAEDIDWRRIHLFFGDERCVPPDHPESNYGMVRAALLRRVAIPVANVHRMQGEAPDPAAAAAAYAAELERPLDLAILGIGPDGHTASLFPGTGAAREMARACVSVIAPGLPTPTRLTLTQVVWQEAGDILFLVTGTEKAAILNEIVRGVPRPDGELPAQAVARRSGPVTILCDRAAAALYGSTSPSR